MSLVLALAALLCRASTQLPDMQSTEVPANRYQALSSGMTIRYRVASSAPTVRTRVDQSFGETDLEDLARAGFTAVRLVISPQEIWPPQSPGQVDGPAAKRLLEKIDVAEKAGLSVVVAPTMGRNDLPTGANLLGKLAGLLAITNPDLTFLEISADPMGMTPDTWRVVEESWLSAIRQNMPRHTLVVRAGGNDEAPDLTMATPVEDRNVVYAFQFYAPSTFTDQCLPGSPIRESDHVTLPYPADMAKIVPLAAGLDDSQKDWAMKYAQEGWNANKISDIIAPVGDWARSHRVRVLCDGFGVSQKVNATDRAAYLKDVKAALSAGGIAWIVTEYLGDRGVYSGSSGLRQADRGILESLGLNG